ncbi:uncharacterized protein LOC122377924 isoform X3 [Amphibalanus amphitrite]|nr:uncharacterized protein LOC122377924 isoform X3 [Amphibalanus amphitrite]
MQANLGAHIGLNHVNITMNAAPSAGPNVDVAFNERFRWNRPTQMREEYRAALVKGLPYPILTVAEHLSANSEGFDWGPKLRTAGYYTSIVIWTSFASWLLMNLMLLTVPRYGAYMMVVTGALMCVACALYSTLKPSHLMAIRLEDAVLRISLGWQFYLVLLAGILCTGVGVLAAIMDLLHPHSFSTILEVDFGTPYDRHMLIVESDESRKRPTLKIPKLEEPITAGLEATSKLIRRLSRRGRDEGSSSDPRGGSDNVAFEMDQPKLPLRAQLSNRRDSKQSFRALGLRRGSNLLDVPQTSLDLPAGPPLPKRPLERTASHQSNASSISIGSSPRPSLADTEQPSFQEQFKRIRQAESRRSSSQSDISSGSSLSDLFRGDPSRFSRQLLEVPVESSPAGAADVSLHPPLEKRDSRSSNIIVFHTQDARGQLTRRQSTDRASMDP